MSDFQLSKDTHVWSFDSDAKPTITVPSGSVIDIETWDCFTGQVTSEKDTVENLDLSRVNSATGPIAVVDAEPGDTIAVTLLDISPGPIGAGMIIPGWGQLIDKVQAPQTRIFHVDGDVIRMNNHVHFPTRPMFGVIGVAPESGSISTFLAGRHGGNLDDRMNGIGATIHMPVFQSGAMLSIGDMHASMGDGEISGTGVEIGGTGQIRVELIKNRNADFPITETATHWYTHGAIEEDGTLTQALTIACEEAARLLVDQWGFSIEDAFIFLSVAGDAGIAQSTHSAAGGPGSVIARMGVPKITACPQPFKI
jgi:amidase